MSPALVVLAAGLGTRFGGDKQTTPLGPGGATLLEYSIYDALTVGFGSVALVVRAEQRDAIERALGAKLRGRVPLRCAVQAMDAPAAARAFAPGRGRPWGTAHAVLAARDVVEGPFVVANADDFYGRDAFGVLARFLRDEGTGRAPAFAIAGFALRDTLTDAGPVNRAICRTDAEGWLAGIEEHGGLTREMVDAAGIGDAPVSMNLWAFTPAIFAPLADGFDAFVRARGAERDAEYLLPKAVSEMVRERVARVRVVPAAGPWCGVTYAADAARVAAFLAAATARGDYPLDLWA
jgi:MobA-like NTP transferase domain